MADLQKNDHRVEDFADKDVVDDDDEDDDEDDDGDYDDCDDEDGDSGISLPEVTCLCCYEILLDPTTLPCGHSFCLHCLVIWLQTSGRNVCPTCRRAWWSVPKVNISFRGLVEKHFRADVARRRQNIMADSQITDAVLAFQQAEHIIRRQPPPPPVQWRTWLCSGGFFSGVILTLTVAAVAFLVSYCSRTDEKLELLVKKPLSFWTSEDVGMWMENLGEWTSSYREVFLSEKVNGRLLNGMEEQDLLNPPFQIENQLHRRSMLKEIQRVQEMGFKRPQNFWEYKAVNEGKSLFLIFALIEMPRVTMLHLYIFDYHDSFLPLIHTTCPAPPRNDSEETATYRNLESPNCRQCLEFGAKFVLLPYQLISDFAWEWMDVHYWMCWIIMWHALMLTVRDGIVLWRLRGHVNRQTILQITFIYMGFLAVLCVGVVLWNLLPQFVWNGVFYWLLFFLPFSTTFALLFPNILLRILNELRNQL